MMKLLLKSITLLTLFLGGTLWAVPRFLSPVYQATDVISGAACNKVMWGSQRAPELSTNSCIKRSHVVIGNNAFVVDVHTGHGNPVRPPTFSSFFIVPGPRTMVKTPLWAGKVALSKENNRGTTVIYRDKIPGQSTGRLIKDSDSVLDQLFLDGLKKILHEKFETQLKALKEFAETQTDSDFDRRILKVLRDVKHKLFEPTKGPAKDRIKLLLSTFGPLLTDEIEKNSEYSYLLPRYCYYRTKDYVGKTFNWAASTAAFSFMIGPLVAGLAVPGGIPITLSLACATVVLGADTYNLYHSFKNAHRDYQTGQLSKKLAIAQKAYEKYDIRSRVLDQQNAKLNSIIGVNGNREKVKNAEVILELQGQKNILETKILDRQERLAQLSPSEKILRHVPFFGKALAPINETYKNDIQNFLKKRASLATEQKELLKEASVSYDPALFGVDYAFSKGSKSPHFLGEVSKDIRSAGGVKRHLFVGGPIFNTGMVGLDFLTIGNQLLTVGSLALSIL